MQFKKEQIELIAYDFDGVMTNNTAIVFQDGTEAVVVNRADGLGIKMISQLNIPQIILSTEENPIVSIRARKLKLPCLQGIENKQNTLESHCQKNNINLKNVIYIGNDINDLEVMKIVGYPLAPADAYHSIKMIASQILHSKGGEGVVRELAEMFKGE